MMLTPLDADTRPSEYRAVCAGLDFHISCCMAGCSDARGSLCEVGERLNMRLLDMLDAFDDAEMDAAIVSLEAAL